MNKAFKVFLILIGVILNLSVIIWGITNNIEAQWQADLAIEANLKLLETEQVLKKTESLANEMSERVSQLRKELDECKGL